jgi:hypothetical protein
MVVSVQPIRLKLASKVQVVAGRFDPDALALVRFLLMVNAKPLVTSADVSVYPRRVGRRRHPQRHRQREHQDGQCSPHPRPSHCLPA